MSRKLVLIIFALIFVQTISVQTVSAATIRGNVYDVSLNIVKNVVLEINSTPTQRFVSKDGYFLFSLPIGIYEISAYYETVSNSYYTSEIISVKDEGRYVLDLFLFPTFDGEYKLEPTKSFYDYITKDNSYIAYGIILALLIISAIIFYFYYFKKKEKEDEESLGELEDVVKLLKKNKGRMTQKEIRKEIPLSEAKISLMISELEDKEKVQKIKKGRGNIIILKKRKRF